MGVLKIEKEFDGKHWNVKLPEHNIYFFTQYEAEIEFLAEQLIARKIRLKKQLARDFIEKDLQECGWGNGGLIEFINNQDTETISDAIVSWMVDFSKKIKE